MTIGSRNYPEAGSEKGCRLWPYGLPRHGLGNGLRNLDGKLPTSIKGSVLKGVSS